MSKKLVFVLLLASLVVMGSQVCAQQLIFPTVQLTSFDRTTYTYVYTVTCPANSTYPFGYFQIDTKLPNAAPTGPWTLQGAIVGGIDKLWPTYTFVWDSVHHMDSACWDPISRGQVIPMNTYWQGTFRLVVPHSQPVPGQAATKDGYVGSYHVHSVMVPGPADETAPTTTISLDGTKGNNDWFISPVSATLTATDPDDAVAGTQYSLNSSNWMDYNAVIQALQDGAYDLAAKSRDVAGNVENPPVQASFKIDQTAPAVNGAASRSANSNGWYNADLPVNYTASDATSGVDTPVAAEPGIQVTFTQTVTGEGSNLSDTGVVVDKAGNSGSFTISGLKIDKTRPQIEGQASRMPNGDGWYNSDVVINYSALDQLSGLDTPISAPAGQQVYFSHAVTGEGIGLSDVGTVADKAGNTASATVSGLNIDKTGPVVAGSPAADPNAYGWYNADVAVNYTAVDALSGLLNPSVADTGVQVGFTHVIVGEGTGLSDTGGATDRAGNVGTFTVGNINVDKTAPTISGEAATQPSADGWYNTDVVVNYKAKDDLSGLAAPSEAAAGAEITLSHTVTGEGADLSDTGTATDKAGNSADAKISLKIDKSAPAVNAAITTTPGPGGWYTSDVVVKYTASDATSGLASPEASDPGAQVTFEHTLSTEGSSVSDSGSATDKAGNTGQAAISGIKIDKTAPQLSFISAPTGQCHMINHEMAVVRFSVSDNAAGVDLVNMPWAVVNCTPTGGWAVPTTKTFTAAPVAGTPGAYDVSFIPQVPGVYTVTLFAKDQAGNVGQIATPVSFGAGGFTVEWRPPLSTMDVYWMQDGSTVPVKFRLIDPCNNNTYVNAYQYRVSVVDSTGKAMLSDLVPQFDTTSNEYHVNVQTKFANNTDWPIGDYTVVITGPGIWDVMDGPYKSKYGLLLIDKSVAKGAGKR